MTNKLTDKSFGNTYLSGNTSYQIETKSHHIDTKSFAQSVLSDTQLTRAQ